MKAFDITTELKRIQGLMEDRF